MTDAEVAALAIAAVAMHDEDGLTALIESSGADRVIRSLGRFAYWQLKRRSPDNSVNALRAQLRQIVQLMDGPNAEA